MLKYRKIIVITIILVIFMLTIGCNNYSKPLNTDLSHENISGIYLLTSYDPKAIETILGKTINRVVEEQSTIYEYATQKFIVSIEINKNNQIINISATALGDNSIKTNKGITKNASFNEVVKVYGENYVREKYSDFMGSGDGYTITYIDKNNKYNLTFDFNKSTGKERLINISLSKIK